MSAWSTAMSLLEQRAGGHCEAQLSPGCGMYATHIHNRGSNSRVNPATHMRVCARCNAWIGAHPHKAKRLGWYHTSTQQPHQTPVWRHRTWVLLGSDGSLTPAPATTP